MVMAHAALGLTYSLGEATALAYLTPRLEREVLIISKWEEGGQKQNKRKNEKKTGSGQEKKEENKMNEGKLVLRGVFFFSFFLLFFDL